LFIILLALAKALNVKVDYFFRPFTVEIESVEFRKKSKLSVKNVNAIKQKVTDFVERYLEVEQFLNIETGRLLIENLSDEELTEIAGIQATRPKLSEQDCSAYFQAQKQTKVHLSECINASVDMSSFFE